MEFVKISDDRYLIKNSNNIIVSKKEKLELEKKELIIKDITSSECQSETTQEIQKIDKELNESSIKEAKPINKRHRRTE